MNNKNLIIGGVILAGIVAYYLYNKNKGGSLASSSSPSTPASSSPATMGGNLTDCKNIVTMPCLVAPCPKICADNVELPKSYDNTSNCENQFKDYERKQNMMKVVREPKTPEQYQAYKQNWIKNNCSLKM